MRRKIDNVKYYKEKQPEKPYKTLGYQYGGQAFNALEKMQDLSKRQNDLSENRMKCMTPIHVPRGLKYLDTFDNIEAKLQRMFRLPESIIPIDLVYANIYCRMNNPNLANIVGAAILTYQEKNGEKAGPESYDIEYGDSIPKNNRYMYCVAYEYFFSLKIPGYSQKRYDCTDDDSDFFIRKPMKSQFF